MPVFQIVFIGLGATLLIDIWALLRAYLFGVPNMDYALVGRWAGHIPHGRFIHTRISESTRIPGEKALGWAIHYGTGVIFTAIFAAFCGWQWMQSPQLMPALVFGLITVAAPFLLLQPGMGAGIAARKTPKPWISRGWSLLTHLCFGLGLYLAALIWNSVIPHIG